MPIKKVSRRIKEFKENGSTNLSLAELQLTDYELKKVLENSEITTDLQHLYLHNNRLKQIPFSKLKHLESLSLSNNQFNQLPNEISELKNLQYLFIDENQLMNSAATILQLPNALKIYISDGKDYIPLSYKIEKIKQIIADLEESIKQNDEANKSLASVTIWLTRFVETFCLIILVSLIIIWLVWDEGRWNRLEPIKYVISLILLTLSAAIGKDIAKWFHEHISEGMEFTVQRFANFVSEKHKNLKLQYEELKAKLDEANNKLRIYSKK